MSDLAQDAIAPDLPSMSDVLDEVEQLLRKYVVFPTEGAAVAATIWIAYTHAARAFDVCPYLAITSAEKECGKTRVLELLELLCRDGWLVEEVSPAALFRKLDHDHPCLLLDEVDGLLTDKSSERGEAIRTILNGGHRRGIRIPRADGPNHSIREYDAAGPKALAGIKDLPGTLASRAIPIRMHRRAGGEVVARWRRRRVEAEARPIRQSLAALVAHLDLDALGNAEPDELATLSDREADLWEPLFSMADTIGGLWPGRVRAAALELHGHRLDERESDALLLLSAIRTVFDRLGVDRIHTQTLVRELLEEDGPWVGWWEHDHGKGQLQAAGSKVAKLLRPFEITSDDLRIGEDVRKGYRCSAFEDVWLRYLRQDTQAATDNAPNSPTSTSTVAAVAAVAPLAGVGVPAEVRRRVREQLDEGMSLFQVAVLLATDGTPPPTGYKGWTVPAVDAVARS
ncbi:MAG: DUF3631 domain-containing protein [Actinomycetota bacterium]